jgi:hypothetical protein
MFKELVAFAQVQAKAAARSIIVPAAFALIAGLFALVAIVALFAALFYWIAPQLGPIGAALTCAAAAIVLAIAALLPVMFKRRPPAPQPAPEGPLPQLVALMAKTAPNLGPRQLIVTAALIGVALLLSPRRNKK